MLCLPAPETCSTQTKGPKGSAAKYLIKNKTKQNKTKKQKNQDKNKNKQTNKKVLLLSVLLVKVCFCLCQQLLQRINWSKY
jgi:Na+/glutamate symporter